MSHCLLSQTPTSRSNVQIAASSKQTQLIIGPSLTVGAPGISRTVVVGHNEEIPATKLSASTQSSVQSSRDRSLLLSRYGTSFPEAIQNEIFLNSGAFMRTQLISCRLPKADSALLRSSLFHHLCRFVSSSSGERRRGSPFAEASDPVGSRNGSTGMRS